MKVLYSYNKKGFEAQYWANEIAGASSSDYQFIPFNHEPYLDPDLYIRAQLLDNLYYEEHPSLMRLYRDIELKCAEVAADVLLVDTCPPYHPEFLRKQSIYKVLRIADGPLASYDRDFAYLHAYDHVLYHSPAYSKDLDMPEKLRYCGAKRIDLWPLAAFDALCDPSKTEATICARPRDIDVIFIGALYLNKMPLLAAVKKAFRGGACVYGPGVSKRTSTLIICIDSTGWMRPIPFTNMPLYQRAKIGINVHNRGDFTVGGYRLFDLPANGVMQISDGGKHLDQFFSLGKEIASYGSAEDLIEKIHYYLEHDDERQAIGLNGFRRVQSSHRFKQRMHQCGELIRKGLSLR